VSAVRKLLDDLVEKRLWPVALLLVIAAIAVPVLICGAGSGATEPAVAAPTPVAAATPAVDLVGPPAVRSRPGRVLDPFRRPKPKAAKHSPTKTASAGSWATGSSATGGARAASGSGQATPSKAVATPPVAPVESAAAIAARSAYETVAHFVGQHYDYEHVLSGLAVFGGTASPALQYLGVGAGGEYAIFLLGPDATASGGDGACVVADPCRAIGLRRGETLHVAVADGQLATRHYVLEVTSLRHVRKATRTLAAAQRARVAVDGRRVLRTLAQDAPTAAALRQLRYLPGSGTVALVDAP
jgi:hypothetical protein